MALRTGVLPGVTSFISPDQDINGAVNEVYNTIHQVPETDPINSRFQSSTSPVRVLDYGKIVKVLLNHYPGYFPNLPTKLKLGGNLDVWEMGEFTKILLDALQGKNLIPQDLDLLYSPAYPDEHLRDTQGVRTHDTPHPKVSHIITWKVTARARASLNPQPFTGRVNSRPRFKEMFRIPKDIEDVRVRYQEAYKDNPDFKDEEGALIPIEEFMLDIPPENLADVVTISSLWFDNIIQFDCFARTQSEAEYLCRAFETTLMRYARLYYGVGANRFLYWDRTEDSELRERTEMNFKYRSVNFYIRTEEFFVESTAAISAVENEIYNTQIGGSVKT